MILPILLAGGIGSRLWPISQGEHPKQFLTLIDENTLLQNSLQLTSSLKSISSPIIICNEKQYLIAAEQAGKIVKDATILVESSSHGTAVASLLSALYAEVKFSDPIILIQPTDAYIEDKNYYAKLIDSALPAVNQGKIILFGIEITEPHTGYGYIKIGKSLIGSGFEVDHFIEKPDLETAQSFLESGQYLWNSGIFLFKASTLIQEAQKYVPELLAICRQACQNAKTHHDSIHLNLDELDPHFVLSLDHGIMQKTKSAMVFPFRSTWADIGDWNMVWRITKKDEKNNVIKGHVIAEDVENCYLHSTSNPLIAIGIKNQVIINTPEAMLVVNISEGQRLKEVLSHLDQKKPK